MIKVGDLVMFSKRWHDRRKECGTDNPEDYLWVGLVFKIYGEAASAFFLHPHQKCCKGTYFLPSLEVIGHEDC